MEYRMSKLTRCSGTLSNPAWQAQTDTAVFLWVSRAKYQFHLRSSSWPFCSDSQSDVVGIWSRDLGVMATLWVRQQMPLFFPRAFITLRSQFHLHHRFQRALTEIVSKMTPNLGRPLKEVSVMARFEGREGSAGTEGERKKIPGLCGTEFKHTHTHTRRHSRRHDHHAVFFRR